MKRISCTAKSAAEKSFIRHLSESVPTTCLAACCHYSPADVRMISENRQKYCASDILWPDKHEKSFLTVFKRFIRTIRSDQNDYHRRDFNTFTKVHIMLCRGYKLKYL